MICPFGARSVKRFYSNGLNAYVGKVLDGKKDTERLISSSEWNVSELIDNDTSGYDDAVDDRVVTKMLEVSGFESDITRKEKDEIKSALKRQIGMINHVYKFSQSSTVDSEVFRLIPSDHKVPKRLNLKQLQEEVEKTRCKTDASMGEVSNSIKNNTLNLKNSYFTIKKE